MVEDKLVFGVAGGLGNVLWQICGILSRRPLEKVQFIGVDVAAKKALEAFICPELLAPDTVSMRMGPIGYWQDTCWLLPPEIVCSKILREDITTHASEAVCSRKLVVHVRGTDFRRSPAHLKSVASQALIDEAKTMLCLEDEDIAIVTDDFELTQSIFGTKYPALGSLRPEDAFHTLCKAKNILIHPGSSFSWWAAYLGKHDSVLFPAAVWPQDIGALDLDLTSSTNGKSLIPAHTTCRWHTLRT